MTKPRLVSGIAAACMVATIPLAFAETFVMTNGDVIEGKVVRALGGMLAIKLERTGLQRVPISDVQRFEIATKDGVIVGRLEGWSNGTYRLSTDRGTVEASVENGVVATTPASEVTDTADVAAVDAATGRQDAPEAPGLSALRAGFVYQGSIDDGGRTFMHEKGRQQLASNPDVERTAALEVDSGDHQQTKNAVDQLVANGTNVVFMTGDDSTAAVIDSARQHGDVRFVHCADFPATSNIDVFCGRIYQARYLTGIIAGGMTKSGQIGYVAARPTPGTIVGINAFTLGAQSVNPDIEIVVNWTLSSYAPGQAQARALELIERGVDVLTVHQDSPAALQVAERHGVDAIGYQSDMSSFAPSSILTSAVWDWGVVYDQVVDRLKGGEAQIRPTWLGLREGAVRLAPISNRVPIDLRVLVRQRQREMADGLMNVFTGPIRDVDGDIRILDGRVMDDEALQTMDFLVQGVVGY